MMRIRTCALLTLACLSSAAAAGAYSFLGPRWAVQEVPYYINPSTSMMSEAAALAAIQAGAAAWSSQSNANILPYYMGRTSGSNVSLNGKSEIFLRNATNNGLYGETYWWHDGSNRLIEADIVFYTGSYQFYGGSTGCSGSGLYLQDTTTHEFGHVLGLGHSSDAAASMYPSMGWCSTSVRSLDADDLSGIEQLYPAGGNNTAPTVAIASPATGASFESGASINFIGSASDKEDGNLAGTISWRSTIDGYLGVGASVSRVLSSGFHVVTASVTDSRGLTATRQISLSVASAPTGPPSPSPTPGLSLTARSFKVKGMQSVELTWSGATTSSVVIRRDGVTVMTTSNDGRETDALNKKGAGSYLYQLCESGTSVCSGSVAVRF